MGLGALGVSGLNGPPTAIWACYAATASFDGLRLFRDRMRPFPSRANRLRRARGHTAWLKGRNLSCGHDRLNRHLLQPINKQPESETENQKKFFSLCAASPNNSFLDSIISSVRRRSAIITTLWGWSVSSRETNCIRPQYCFKETDTFWTRTTT